MTHLAKTSEESANLIRHASLNKFAEKMYRANSDNTLKQLTMDIANSEVLDFLQKLYDHQVKYLLVGGVATSFHGYIRTTMDLDLWVKEVPDNKEKLILALKDAGVAGAEHYSKVEMIAGWSSLTIGDTGFVVDFMNSLKNFSSEDFDVCHARAKTGIFEGVPITVIHLNDLIQEKLASGRPKDLDDAENLIRIRKSKSEQ